MQKLGLNELREKYLSFFESKGHLRLPSFSLIPQNDPSLLLINSGMAPLKPYFTGQQTPPSKRVTTCQKCIRTPDIENVGKTARHGTFFEMLGNFSFGDYFKKEAITWAWEFVTKELGMPEDRLFVSIYEQDDEAFDIWHNIVGLPENKIFRMGKKDNFWEHGVGPCGPCSEIYFDRGPEKACNKPDCTVGCDCDRYIEFWNNVFTQFYRDENGNYTRLANPNIDTGMGLERLACIMQGADNLFEVDTVWNILQYVCKIAGIEYKQSEKQDVSIRVITDHIRSTTMMVCDGVIPSNEGRGYVLRRLLRRAARHGRLLGINKPFLYDVARLVINESKSAYPELSEKALYITKVIRIEEERFEATVDQGLSILNDIISETKQKNQEVIDSDSVFKLHDTYGFPLDLTREIAQENGLGIDEEGFVNKMNEQKNKAREAFKQKAGSAWDDDIYSKLFKNAQTEFVGYDMYETQSVVQYIVINDELSNTAQEGDYVVIVLDRTPFYAESGGQAGDSGVLESQNAVVEIEDCKKTPDGKFLHIGFVRTGMIETGSKVSAKIDIEKRKAAARNHTATHLLQKALKNILGSHVSQAGSLVDSEKLRFDFSHFSGLTVEEIEKVENEVNEKIFEDIKVTVTEMPVEEAKKLGATALFGEKYSNIVRVVCIGDYSMELCGGTHLQSTSQAGLFKILSEGGVAAGVRRIEAVTGKEALKFFREREKILAEVSAVLKSGITDLSRKASSLVADLKSAEKEIEKLKNKVISSSIEDILSNVQVVNNIKIVCAEFDQLDADSLRNTADIIRSKLGTGVVVLASSYSDRVNFVAMASKDAVSSGIHCGNIVKEISKIAGGGGGGRPDMAQAGGKDVSKIDDALKQVLTIVSLQLGNK